MRQRFVIAFETALRPETLDRLSVPEHYVRGAATLTITDEIDKARFGRVISERPTSPGTSARRRPTRRSTRARRRWHDAFHGAPTRGWKVRERVVFVRRGGLEPP